jgi:hypothetical protein
MEELGDVGKIVSVCLSERGNLCSKASFCIGFGAGLVCDVWVMPSVDQSRLPGSSTSATSILPRHRASPLHLLLTSERDNPDHSSACMPRKLISRCRGLGIAQPEMRRGAVLCIGNVSCGKAISQSMYSYCGLFERHTRFEPAI